MPTKAQAKAAIDSAVTAIKADIDGILPSGVNITDGSIQFAPQHWVIRLNSGSNASDALTLAGTILSNLTSAGRSGVIVLNRREGEGRAVVVQESSLTVLISGF